MGLGEAHLAMIALGASSRNLIYGGENLSLISQSMSDRTKMIVSEAAVQNMNTIQVELCTLLLIQLSPSLINFFLL